MCHATSRGLIKGQALAESRPEKLESGHAVTSVFFRPRSELLTSPKHGELPRGRPLAYPSDSALEEFLAKRQDFGEMYGGQEVESIVAVSDAMQGRGGVLLVKSQRTDAKSHY